MSESIKTPPNSTLFTIDNILRSEPKKTTFTKSNEEAVVTTTTTSTSTNGGALTLAERLAGEERMYEIYISYLKNMVYLPNVECQQTNTRELAR